jgi:hypothetical protein
VQLCERGSPGRVDLDDSELVGAAPGGIQEPRGDGATDLAPSDDHEPERHAATLGVQCGEPREAGPPRSGYIEHMLKAVAQFVGAS